MRFRSIILNYRIFFFFFLVIQVVYPPPPLSGPTTKKKNVPSLTIIRVTEITASGRFVSIKYIDFEQKIYIFEELNVTTDYFAMYRKAFWSRHLYFQQTD